jgi:hypothetical protein
VYKRQAIHSTPPSLLDSLFPPGRVFPLLPAPLL